MQPRPTITASLAVAFLIASCGSGATAPTQTIQPSQTATATPVSTAAPGEPGQFDEGGFAFTYPTDWHVITAADYDTLLSGGLKGLGDFDYLGGVYAGSLDNCDTCAQVTMVVVSEPSLPGGMSDEMFANAKAAAEEQMGSRIISYTAIKVDGLDAAENQHLGKSGTTQLWDVIILPPKPGVLYSLSMSSSADGYLAFMDDFGRLLDSMQIDRD
jgi:hypothetical protein